ncbi:hypothetical protein EPAKOI_002463 [Cupriavidus sp. H18C2]
MLLRSNKVAVAWLPVIPVIRLAFAGDTNGMATQ